MDELLSAAIEIWKYLPKDDQPKQFVLTVGATTFTGVPVESKAFLDGFKTYRETQLSELQFDGKITHDAPKKILEFQLMQEKLENGNYVYLKDDKGSIWRIPKSEITAWAIG